MSEVFRRNKWKDGSKLFDLEKDHGFRLFVPQRDFTPGREVAQQIQEGMEKSRKIIFIISRYIIYVYQINLKCCVSAFCVSSPLCRKPTNEVITGIF